MLIFINVLGVLLFIPCVILFTLGLIVRPLVQAFVGGFYFVDVRMLRIKKEMVDEIIAEEMEIPEPPPEHFQ